MFGYKKVHLTILHFIHETKRKNRIRFYINTYVLSAQCEAQSYRTQNISILKNI